MGVAVGGVRVRCESRLGGRGRSDTGDGGEGVGNGTTLGWLRFHRLCSKTGCEPQLPPYYNFLLHS